VYDVRVFSGNSQYHYYGIRIKSMSPLNQVGCDGLLLSRQHVFSQAKRYLIYSAIINDLVLEPNFYGLIPWTYNLGLGLGLGGPGLSLYLESCIDNFCAVAQAGKVR